jgi:hypothetical protein
MLASPEQRPPQPPRKSLLDRLVDCREKEIRHEPCDEDKKK